MKTKATQTTLITTINSIKNDRKLINFCQSCQLEQEEIGTTARKAINWRKL